MNARGKNGQLRTLRRIFAQLLYLRLGADQLVYLGLPRLMKVPEQKALPYTIVLTLVGLLCVEFTLMPVTDWLLAHGWLVTPTLP